MKNTKWCTIATDKHSTINIILLKLNILVTINQNPKLPYTNISK